MGRTLRHWLPIFAGALTVVIAGAMLLVARFWIPQDAATVALARAVLTESAPRASGSELAATAPSGGDCFPRIERGGGWLDLCWEAYRLAPGSEASEDFYLLRLYGSHQGLRWLVVRSQLVGGAANQLYDVWPTGTFDGACHEETVSLLVPIGPLPAATICGRTEASLEQQPSGHRLAWSCERCIAPDSAMRDVEMYAVVGMVPGAIPSWDLFADVGQ